MNKMMSMNVNVEVSQCGGGSKFVKAIRVIQQDRVKHHSEIRQKWLDLVEGCNQTGKYDITLKVQAGSSTKHSSNRISIFKVAPAPAPDGQFIKPGQTLCSEDQNIFIEVPNNSIKQASLEAASLLLKLFIQITLLDNPSEAVVLLVVMLILVAILRHQRMNGTNHPGGTLQINTIGFLLVGSMSFPGAHAHDFNNDTCLIDSAKAVADGNVSEEGDNFKVAAFFFAVIVVGGASLWIMLKSRPKFQIDQSLRQTPIPTRTNPVFEIRPMVECEEALLN